MALYLADYPSFPNSTAPDRKRHNQQKWEKRRQLHKTSAQEALEKGDMAVRRRADAADAIPDVGWGDSIRFVIPLCVPHLAGGVKCQFEGRTVAGQPGHHPRG